MVYDSTYQMVYDSTYQMVYDSTYQMVYDSTYQMMYDSTYQIRLFFKQCSNFTLGVIDILEQNLTDVVPCIRRTSQTKNSSRFLY